MLDHGTIHINHIKSTVRTNREINRSKPIIRARQEFHLGTGSTRPKYHTIWFQNSTVDQVAWGLAHKNVIEIFSGQRTTTIHRNATSGCDLSRVIRVRGPVPGEREDLGCCARWSHVVSQCWHLQQWLAVEIATLQHNLFGCIAVSADKTVPEIVVGQAKLPATSYCAIVASQRIETKITTGNRNRPSRRAIRCGTTNNRPVSQSIGDVDSMIRAKCRMIGT